MFIGDETGGRHKRDNFPKDRVILSLVLSPLDGDMLVVLDQELSKTRLALLTVKEVCYHISWLVENIFTSTNPFLIVPFLENLVGYVHSYGPQHG